MTWVPWIILFDSSESFAPKVFAEVLLREKKRVANKRAFNAESLLMKLDPRLGFFIDFPAKKTG